MELTVSHKQQRDYKKNRKILSATVVYTIQRNIRLNANLVCLMFSGQEFLGFVSDLHTFYWLVWDLGRKPELMPLLPLQTDARHP